MSSRPNAHPESLTPLRVRCTNSDCENGLHCFKKTRRMAPDRVGGCRHCGVKLVDWDRVHRRDLSDVAFTFQALKYEWVRHHMWHKPIDDYARLRAHRKGKQALREAARKRIWSSVGKAEPFRDGRQTPFSGNVLYYAQHAVACCCRTCMEYWHGIPKHVALTEDQVDYFVELMMMFIDERMPELTEEGEIIPPRRQVRP